MVARVYIDGSAGTAGLRIRDLLRNRADLELLEIDSKRRKDSEARAELLRSADAAVLCLPDAAAREAVALLGDRGTRVIDASTAHRVEAGWVYGLPELARDQRDAIRSATRVANPGCYATAVVLLVRPLVDAGLVSADLALRVHALSGYTGGGRTMIERWEDPGPGLSTLAFEAPYALDRVHKHIPEMQRYAGLTREPQFVPAVGPFRCGMRVEVPLHAAELRGEPKALWEVLERRYRDEPFARVVPIEEPAPSDERALDPSACNDTNRIELFVVPHPSGHALLVAILDNLGKGAAGVAVQNLNLMLGRDEREGLMR